MRTGRPQNEIKHTGAAMFEELYSEPERLEQFMDAMSGISAGNFQALAEKFDFSRYADALRRGRRDRPAVDVPRVTAIRTCAARLRPAGGAPIAAAQDRGRRLCDRVTRRPRDFFADPLPKADVITMGMILHDWNLEKKLHLIRAAYDALPEGGAFVVIENLIDDARRENAFGLMMSLNMLIEFGDALRLHGRRLLRLVPGRRASRTEVMPLAGPASAGVAYK